MFKKFRFIAFGFGLLLCIIIFSTWIATRFYENEIASYVISRLNKHIKTKISVKEVSFSVFKKFPHATIRFTDLVVYAPENFKMYPKNKFSDTVLYSNHLYLQFNMALLMKGQYQLEALYVEDGFTQLLINNKGTENFRFWNSTEKKDTLQISFEIEKLIFRNFSLLYYNQIKDMRIQCYTPKLKFTGALNHDEFTLKTLGQIEICEFKMEQIKYNGQCPLDLSIDMAVKNNLFTIHTGVINIDNNRFTIGGKLQTGKVLKPNIEIRAEKIDMANFLLSVRNFFDPKFNIDGKLDAKVKITGNIDKQSNARISGTFSLTNGLFVYLPSQIEIVEIFLNGSFDNGKRALPSSTVVRFDHFKGRLKNSTAEGTFLLSDLNTPKCKLTSDINLNLKEIYRFTGDTTFQLSGNLKGKLNYIAAFPSLSKLTLSTLINQDVSFNGNIDQVMIIPSGLDPITIEKAEIALSDTAIRIIKASLLARKQKMNINASCEGILSLIDSISSVHIMGDISSPSFNLDEIMKFIPDGSLEKNGEKQFFARFAVKANTFIYDPILASNSSATILYNNGDVIVQDMLLNTLSGKVQGDLAFLETRNGQTDFKANLSLQKIDIQELLNAYKNFNQGFITYEKVKGICNLNLKLAVTMDKNYDFLIPSLTSECNISLINGELMNFEPMYKLSKFIDVDELKHIYFSELSNTIYINNQVITVPQMQINSSAFNVTLSGEHKFTNQFDYHLSLLLNELLWKKSKKKKEMQDEFGIIEDDGLGKIPIYIQISGNPDDIKILYDKNLVRQKINQNLKQEKQTVKQLLNEEFGIFKKDTTLRNQKVKPGQKPKFTIEWEELDSVSNN